MNIDVLWITSTFILAFCGASRDVDETSTDCSPFDIYTNPIPSWKCKDKCPPVYYYEDKTQVLKDNNKICRRCDRNCLTCTDQKYCTECKAKKHYITTELGTLCLDECPEGYSSGTSSMCKPCRPNCLKCEVKDGVYKCLACQESYYLIVDDTNLSSHQSCVHDCISGYYACEMTKTCRKCSYMCKTCDRQFYNCSSCNPRYFLVEVGAVVPDFPFTLICVRTCDFSASIQPTIMKMFHINVSSNYECHEINDHAQCTCSIHQPVSSQESNSLIITFKVLATLLVVVIFFGVLFYFWNRKWYVNLRPISGYCVQRIAQMLRYMKRDSKPKRRTVHVPNELRNSVGNVYSVSSKVVLKGSAYIENNIYPDDHIYETIRNDNDQIAHFRGK